MVVIQMVKKYHKRHGI